MAESTHRAEVVQFNPRKLEGSDFLSIVDVDGYTCVVRTEDWVGRTKAVYVPPDSLVEVKRPEFAFLAKDVRADGYARVKARRFRGALSFGLLVPAPDNAVLGEDWAERLGIVHYDPDVHGENKSERGGLSAQAEIAKAPDVYCVKYDLEAGRKYAQKMFEEGEPVIVTEKIHGASLRAVFSDDKFHVGSRTTWKKEYPDYSHLTEESLTEKLGSVEQAQEMLNKIRSRPVELNQWWKGVRKHPQIEEFCRTFPDYVVYGELYGAVQDLPYNHKKGDVSVAVFDIMRDGKFLDYDELADLCSRFNLPTVPLVAGPIPFNFDQVCEMAEGKTLVPGASHVREGVVVRTLKERRHERYGRCVLKWVGAGYLERSK